MPTFGELTGEMSMSGDVDVTGLETPPLPGSMFYLPCITHFHSLVYIGCLSPVFLNVKACKRGISALTSQLLLILCIRSKTYFAV